MVAILLGILSVIGKILLGILLLLLVVLLLILCTPICYRLRVKYQDEVLLAEVGGSWFLQLLRLRVTFQFGDSDSNLQYVVRIFGIPIKKGTAAKKEPGNEKGSEAQVNAADAETDKAEKEAVHAETGTTKASGAASEPQNISADEHRAEESLTAGEKPLITDFGDSGSKADAAYGSGRNSDGSARKKPTAEPGRWKYMPDPETEERAKKLKPEIVELERPGFLHRLLAQYGGLVGKIRKAIRRAADAYRGFRRKADPWIEYLRTESFRRLKNRIFRVLGRMLKHILPRKTEGWLLFGFEDPALTGELLGYMYAANLLMPKGWKVREEAVFDKQEIACDLMIRGHVFLGYLLLQILGLLLNRDTFRLIRLFLRERKKNKNTQ
ncbi:MAG: hypothetical protein Q4B22_01830 [Eubacteriales bacterium]|nr:hypothetical protein [Eubacteriales bacterium]